jgi:uncharacterized membrane protein YwaF
LDEINNVLAILILLVKNFAQKQRANAILAHEIAVLMQRILRQLNISCDS